MMVEERKYHKVKSKGKPIVFHENERWIQMKDLSDSSYYISDHGRVSRLNPQGIFHEIKNCWHCKSIYVSIEMESGDHTRKRVGRLVLKYFVGGERPKRRYIHLDGDLENCKLTNLRWRKGFVDQVDFLYLKRLNESRMPEESKIVKRFLETEETEEILNLIISYKKLMYYKDFVNGTKYFKRNDYLSFAIIAIDQIIEGKFKPNTKNREIISFKSFLGSLFMTTSFRYKQMRECNTFEWKINSLKETPVFDEQIILSKAI